MQNYRNLNKFKLGMFGSSCLMTPPVQKAAADPRLSNIGSYALGNTITFLHCTPENVILTWPTYWPKCSCWVRVYLNSSLDFCDLWNLSLFLSVFLQSFSPSIHPSILSMNVIGCTDGATASRDQLLLQSSPGTPADRVAWPCCWPQWPLMSEWVTLSHWMTLMTTSLTRAVMSSFEVIQRFH